MKHNVSQIMALFFFFFFFINYKILLKLDKVYIESREGYELILQFQPMQQEQLPKQLVK